MSGHPLTAHKAGPLTDGVQKCVLCGRVMTDYRGAMTDSPRPLRGWAEGAWVAMSDDPSSQAGFLVTSTSDCIRCGGVA